MTGRRVLITALLLAVMALCVWMWRWNDYIGWTQPGPWLIAWSGLQVPVWLTIAAWSLAATALGVVWLWRPRPRLLVVAPALAVLLLVTAYGILMESQLLVPPVQTFPLGGPSLHGQASPVSGIVPWVDRPAVSLGEPSQSPQPPADGPPCQPSDLRVSAGPIGVGLGNTVLPVTFVNASSSACTLVGYPSLMGITVGGAPESIPVGHGSYFGDPGPAANLAPNGIGVAVVNISGADACQAAQSGMHKIYEVLRIGLPAGGSVDVDGSTFDTICGVFASLFGVPAAASPPEALPPLTLSAEIRAPASVAPGAMLRYVVTITNAADADYSLVPCPVYEQFVGSGPGTTSGTTWIATVLDGYLNCETVHAIPAHGAVRYEMRLAIPENQPGGVAKFGWDLLGGRGPWANARLQVEPGT